MVFSLYSIFYQYKTADEHCSKYQCQYIEIFVYEVSYPFAEFPDQESYQEKPCTAANDRCYYEHRNINVEYSRSYGKQLVRNRGKSRGKDYPEIPFFVLSFNFSKCMLSETGDVIEEKVSYPCELAGWIIPKEMPDRISAQSAQYWGNCAVQREFKR